MGGCHSYPSATKTDSKTPSDLSGQKLWVGFSLFLNFQTHFLCCCCCFLHSRGSKQKKKDDWSSGWLNKGGCTWLTEECSPDKSVSACVCACVRACVCVCFAYFPDGISKTWIPPTALTHVERQSFRRSRIDVVYLRVFSLSPVQIFAPGRVCVCVCVCVRVRARSQLALRPIGDSWLHPHGARGKGKQMAQ